jgi:hypothetical protein
MHASSVSCCHFRPFIHWVCSCQPSENVHNSAPHYALLTDDYHQLNSSSLGVLCFGTTVGSLSFFLKFCGTHAGDRVEQVRLAPLAVKRSNFFLLAQSSSIKSCHAAVETQENCYCRPPPLCPFKKKGNDAALTIDDALDRRALRPPLSHFGVDSLPPLRHVTSPDKHQPWLSAHAAMRAGVEETTNKSRYSLPDVQQWCSTKGIGNAIPPHVLLFLVSYYVYNTS